MTLKVIKRDGSREAFDEDKIFKVVKAAGLDDKEIKKLTDLIKNWIKKEKYKELTSLQIRDKIVTEIQKLNKVAAHKYIWYEKYKDKYYGVHF